MSPDKKPTSLRPPVRKAVIPVAGFGTRFLPATKATPKEMFPLVDKPLTQYVVEEAVACGIEEIVFVTGQAKRAIEDHFDRNIELEYLLDNKGKKRELEQVMELAEKADFVYVRQKEMLGLGHAILQARHLIGDEPFLVMTPDDVFSDNSGSNGRPAAQTLIDAYEKVGTPIIGVQEVPKDRVHLYGIVSGEPVGDGLLKMTGIIEKPDQKDAPTNLAQCGRYLFVPEIFEHFAQAKPGKSGEIHITEGIKGLISNQTVHAAMIPNLYHDAGSKLGYLQAIVEFALARDDLGEEFETYLRKRLKNA
ncbi:MAG: UTP--glucose-1-phosphate uridylyltransferase GalU [bacterium]|nr:UTP--glucose-1-phosphate uridylyltransferase GalU [bacterium]